VTVQLVVVEGLIKSYPSPDGERQVVIDVPRFSLAAGELVALRGSSGSGKTTFLNLVAGILTADSGRIAIDGVDLESLDEAGRDRVRAERLGYVFQTFNLLQGYTALENVELGMAFGRGIDAARARKLLERVGLGDRMDYRPRQLSVGQQQRVALARALANEPVLVLADEPTGNLDVKRAHEAIDLLLEVCRENRAALLLVSHDTNVLARFADVRDLADINRAASSTTNVVRP
jgi:ABC-type lipoprotein export system ATPase subunit